MALDMILYFYTSRLPKGTVLDEAARGRLNLRIRYVMEQMQEAFNRGYVAEYAPRNIFPWPA